MSEEETPGDLAGSADELGIGDEPELLDPADLEEGVSLEELSQSYANVLSVQPDEAVEADAEAEDSHALVPDEEIADQCPVTPQSILEAVLFVGRADGGSILAEEIASLMRGVKTDEIADLVRDLNEEYATTGSALRVVDAADGFRIELAEDLSPVRERFYGRVREVSLNQAAVDCLALIVYQPGISRKRIEEQRNQPSGGVLNQLVRRQLIEMRREPVEPETSEGTVRKPKLEPHYYPTQKLLQLAGLNSLEDLPQVEEFDLG